MNRINKETSWCDIQMSTPLEDFAMIGDGETVALVSRAGSIDWLCLPRFDSPACCAAILGSSEHGRWLIAPEGNVKSSTHNYQGDTLILETEFTTEKGTIRVTDFMPIREGNSSVVRTVSGLSGRVETQFELVLRFDYGDMLAWVDRDGEGIVLHVGPDKVVLRGPGTFDVEDGTVRSRFMVEVGSTHSFVLTYGASHDSVPAPIAPLKALAATKKYWGAWIGRFDQPVEHADAVRRSLLTLKALIHRPTGGLVAAPTTSLPEQAGGTMNWDYRYCWLRDATFTLNALVDCGYTPFTSQPENPLG